MPLDFDRIKAICFDVDGTLCDTDDMWMKKIEKFLSPISSLFPRVNIQNYSRRLIMGIETPGNLVYHLLDRLHIDDEIGWLFDRMAKIGKNNHNRNYWIIPGGKEVVHAMSHSFPMAIVSAKSEKGTLAFLQQFSLLSYFKSVVTAQTCKYTKPYPDPIHKAALDLGVNAEECLMVGDTVVDIRAGRAAGAQTVGVLCGFGAQEELKRAGADVILDSPVDLIPLFLQSKIDDFLQKNTPEFQAKIE